jgi:RNA polymerase-associated protein
MLYRIERDWYQMLTDIDAAKDKRAANKIRKILTESLVNAAEMFTVKKFFMSDEYTLVDASILPVLWRLNEYEIELPKEGQPLLDYAKRHFIRAAFKMSLTELEAEMPN